VITLEDWALIRRLHLGGWVSKAQIAARLGISRNTVAKAVAADRPPVFHRDAPTSAFDEFESQIRALLSQTPSMPATVIAEGVGWSGSASWLRKRVALIRPEYAPGDAADRIMRAPGDEAQMRFVVPASIYAVAGRGGRWPAGVGDGVVVFSHDLRGDDPRSDNPRLGDGKRTAAVHPVMPSPSLVTMCRAWLLRGR